MNNIKNKKLKKLLFNDNKIGKHVLNFIILLLLFVSISNITIANEIFNRKLNGYSFGIFVTDLNQSVGINDNGSLLYDGKIIEYNYSTNALLGVFNFYGGSFYSGNPVNYSVFSVQLNSNFNVGQYGSLWVQNVFQVYKLYTSENKYEIYIMDNLWNSTYPFNLSPNYVKGNGNVIVSDGQGYYIYNEKNYYISSPPFTLMSFMNLSETNQGYPILSMYYLFSNSTFNSGLVKYDEILISQESNNSEFLIGLNPSIKPYYLDYPFVTQWVIGGAYGGSQLSIYSWNASMQLYYEYDNKLFSIPDGISLQPSNFKATVTGESVNQYNGISEFYFNGYVYQEQGQNYQKFLWEPSLNYTINGNNLTLELTPPQGEWFITIKGSNYYNKTFGVYSPISYYLPNGNYTVNATLYSGKNPILTITKNVTISGGLVIVNSPVKFLVNGYNYSPGNYNFLTPVNLTFPSIVMINNTSRLVFRELIINENPTNSISTVIYENANVTAVYVLQYYVKINHSIPAFINGNLENLSSNYYNSSTMISIISPFYFNKTYRMIISSNVSNITLVSSIIVNVNTYYQYYVYIRLPNGTISNWYNRSFVIVLPSIIYNGSKERYVLNQSNQIIVNSPVNITPNYKKQYFVELILPDRSIGNWYNYDSKIRLYFSVPLYETLKWVGNYTIPNGYYIIINGPIMERAIISINVTFLIFMIIFVTLIFSCLIASRRNRR